MALLSRKKKILAKEEKKEVSASSIPSISQSGAFSGIILRPRVTEKASSKSMNENVYVFDVSKNSDKALIKKAIMQIYKVRPVKIAVVKIPSKKVFARGKVGVRSSGKKAYVYLRKGDKIEIV